MASIEAGARELLELAARLGRKPGRDNLSRALELAAKAKEIAGGVVKDSEFYIDAVKVEAEMLNHHGQWLDAAEAWRQLLNRPSGEERAIGYRGLLETARLASSKDDTSDLLGSVQVRIETAQALADELTSLPRGCTSLPDDIQPEVEQAFAQAYEDVMVVHRDAAAQVIARSASVPYIQARQQAIIHAIRAIGTISRTLPLAGVPSL
jgi:hypothetical protein